MTVASAPGGGGLALRSRSLQAADARAGEASSPSTNAIGCPCLDQEVQGGCGAMICGSAGAAGGAQPRSKCGAAGGANCWSSVGAPPGASGDAGSGARKTGTHGRLSGVGT
ncbi:MAG: hypothetical protein ACPIOQ_72795 [Promethearchaeia archaeon]